MEEVSIYDIDITILITCYNEDKYIIDTIITVLRTMQAVGCTYEVIVIDDASKDDSVKKIKEYIEKYPEYPIRLKVNEKNKGLANNFVDGAFLGKGKYYRLCCGDNPEPEETLIHLFKHIGSAEIVIPYQNQKEVQGKSGLRKILSRMIVHVVNILSGFNIKYYNGLPIYLRYHVMRWPPITYGFGFQIDIITRLLDEGVNYLQIPTLVAIDRKAGKSVALSMRNILSVLHSFLEIIFRRARRTLYGKQLKKAIEIKSMEELHFLDN